MSNEEFILKLADMIKEKPNAKLEIAKYDKYGCVKYLKIEDIDTGFTGGKEFITLCLEKE